MYKTIEQKRIKFQVILPGNFVLLFVSTIEIKKENVMFFMDKRFL